jgi:hypothetical protein
MLDKKRASPLGGKTLKIFAYLKDPSSLLRRSSATTAAGFERESGSQSNGSGHDWNVYGNNRQL